MTWMYVAFGSAIGGALRYWSIRGVDALVGERFPWGTLFVNITGSLLLGLVLGLLTAEHRWTLAPHWRQFVVVGVFGGFTTFSTFSMQTVALIQIGAWGSAMANMAGSVLLCVGAAAIGFRGGLALAG